MKITLLNDTDGRENIGCQLTSGSMKAQLISAFSQASERGSDFLSGPTPVSEVCQKYQQADLKPFPWAFGKGCHTNRIWISGLVNIGFRQNATPAIFSNWLRSLAEQEYGQDAVASALASNLVVCHPEGSISDTHGASRILNLLSLPMLACMAGIPTYTLNGTFPLYAHSDRRYQIIKRFLDACHFCALRDRITAVYYDVDFLPDAAIMHDPPCSQDPSVARPYVLITTGAGLSKKDNLEIARSALRFCDEYHLKPLILTKKYKDFLQLKHEVVKRGGRFLGNTTLLEAGQWLSQCALHIGGRYHMALFGLPFNVPSVLIRTNTHKNLWLAEEFNGITLAADPGGLFDQAALLYQQRESLNIKIPESVSAARECFRNGMQQAISLLGAKPELSGNTHCENLSRDIMHLLKPIDFLAFQPLKTIARLVQNSRYPIPANGGSGF